MDLQIHIYPHISCFGQLAIAKNWKINWHYFYSKCLCPPRFFGHFSYHSDWQLIKIDYSSLFGRKCTDGDFQTWHLHNKVVTQHLSACLTVGSQWWRANSLTILYEYFLAPNSLIRVIWEIIVTSRVTCPNWVEINRVVMDFCIDLGSSYLWHVIHQPWLSLVLCFRVSIFFRANLLPRKQNMLSKILPN